MVSTIVIMPTYNEIESLPLQVDAVQSVLPEVEILVVDDGSPDGTGYWAQERADADPRVHVVHRTKKEGLGAAYLTGFDWAFERGYDRIVEMDADGSHQARSLPALLEAAEHHDLVLGSRWVAGGAVENWPRRRQLLSRAANTYVRFMLGMGVRDATAGYRVYAAPLLRQVDLHGVQSQGYCFQIDMCWRMKALGASIAEVPITFVEREHGVSKMSGFIIREALTKVTWWGIKHRVRQVTGSYRRQRAT